MEWFLVAKNEGLLAVQKKPNLTLAWQRVLDLARAAWGEEAAHLTEVKVADKYQTERKRYLAWAKYTSYSGVSCDPETGTVEGVDVSDEAWQIFAERVKGTAVTWISLGLPLGKVSTYRSLWAIDTAKGDHIQVPAAAVAIPPAPGLDVFGDGMPPPSNPPRAFSPASRLAVIGGEEGTEEEVEVEEARPRRETAEVRRRRETDPDLTALSDGDSWELVNVQRGRSRAPSRRFPPSPLPSSPTGPSPSPSGSRASTYSGSVDSSSADVSNAAVATVATGLSSIAAAITSANQANALTEAATDLRQRYQGTRPLSAILTAVKKLGEGNNVALWNSMDAELKDLFMDDLSG
ncbi:hypothetical protein GGTG_14376 [Gaeumannomyces tritici R3-111a-1]|uniref:Myb/SANT-like domain-containing protein n=1 Tax=Gaeumannomyces tritici (strain R3-111a-1) TaxID=644352 RepID=J3PLB7_GAET3|nr:hypothetical protein GGTG_14376 [Gaeumannomyces tritici R3-111a-1]EJT68045.1 hypothetical protein GGTG_14376 [Gaeumannomyces tritici R3-111a-1]